MINLEVHDLSTMKRTGFISIENNSFEIAKQVLEDTDKKILIEIFYRGNFYRFLLKPDEVNTFTDDPKYVTRRWESNITGLFKELMSISKIGIVNKDGKLLWLEKCNFNTKMQYVYIDVSFFMKMDL